jgi:cytochrome c oxidase assembly protein subunit 15
VSRRRPFTVSPSLAHRLNQAVLALVTLIVLTGGAVRLTGSGLGCSDWPDCSTGHLTPALQFHPLIEFSNRVVTDVLVVAVAAAFLGAIFRSPRRRDLIWLSGGLVAGILAQAVIGGIVVLTKLNPYWVMLHLVATLVLVANAVVLVHRSTRDYSPGSGRALVPRALLQFQEVAKRIPVAFRDLAELHAVLAMLLVGATVGLVVGLHVGDIPERVRRAGRMLLVVMVAQAAVGYTQYFTHLPAALVEVHILGATLLVAGAVHCFLSCTFHPTEQVAVPAAEPRTGAGLPIGAR